MHGTKASIIMYTFGPPADDTSGIPGQSRRFQVTTSMPYASLESVSLDTPSRALTTASPPYFKGMFTPVHHAVMSHGSCASL